MINYVWKINGVVVGTSSTLSYSFGEAGTYKVSLTVDNDGEDENTWSVTYDIFGTDYDAYTWDFGDGNTSDETSPANVYYLPGLYDVSLSVDGVLLETKTNYIDAYGVGITGTPDKGTAPLRVLFQPTTDLR